MALVMSHSVLRAAENIKFANSDIKLLPMWNGNYIFRTKNKDTWIFLNFEFMIIKSLTKLKLLIRHFKNYTLDYPGIV